MVKRVGWESTVMGIYQAFVRWGTMLIIVGLVLAGLLWIWLKVALLLGARW